MTTTLKASPNGTSRKSLAQQIDRLDHILDGLADGLNDALAMVVQQAVEVAVRQAVQTVLEEVFTHPEVLAQLHSHLVPEETSVFPPVACWAFRHW